MKNHYLKQIDFEKWDNSVIINAINQSNEPNERVFQLLGHVVSSYSIWLSRILNETPTTGSWDKKTIEECQQYNENNHRNWSDCLQKDSHVDFARLVSFDFFGEKSQVSVHDIIIHSVNHGSYHRGQIIALLKGKLENCL